MNILFWERSINPSCGGVERVTWLLAQYLEQHEYDCFFAFSNEDYAIVGDSKKIQYSKKMSAEVLANNLLVFIIKNKIDIIVNQGLLGENYASALKAIKSRAKVRIITCHHLSPDYQKYHLRSTTLKAQLKDIFKEFLSDIGFKKYSPKKYVQDIFYLSDRFVLLSESFVHDFITRYNLKDEKKIACISDPCTFQEVLPHSELGNKNKEVLIISRLEDVQKNITGALRIWKEIERRGHSDWTMLLGGYGPDESYIIDYAKQLGLVNFRFLGKVENVQNYYAQASVFMMTSRYEGFGMTLTESMQLGCVPIAFNSYASLQDIIENNKNGIIVTNNNYNEYVDKLEYLLVNDKKRKELGYNAIISSKKFSIDTIGKQWLTILELLK